MRVSSHVFSARCSQWSRYTSQGLSKVSDVIRVGCYHYGAANPRASLNFGQDRKYAHFVARPSQISSSSFPCYNGSVDHSHIETHQPPLQARNEAEAWLANLEDYLPLHLRKDFASRSGPTPAAPQPRTELPYLILEARRMARIDMLYHIGVVEKRWKAAIWIAKAFLKVPGLSDLKLDEQQKDILEKSPDFKTLHEITYQKFKFMFKFQPSVSQHQYRTLASITGDRGVPPRRSEQAHYVLGQLWTSLGTMILAAAQENEADSTLIMSNVLHILALLHRNGCIPERVFVYSVNDDPSALLQPSLLHSHSSKLVSILDDVAILHETVGHGTRLENTDPKRVTPATLFLSHTGEIGPEIWLEFVLWCCVHGGWPDSGVAILEKMKKYRDSQTWSLVCGGQILHDPPCWENSSPQEVREHSLQKSMGASDLGDVKSPHRGVKRTISSEVVIALVYALTSSTSMTSPKLPVSRLLDMVIVLKSILDRDKMSLGASTWDTVIARFADSLHLQSETHTKVLDMLLGMAQPYGKEAEASNAALKGDQTNPLSAYVFDGSAAILGLSHRTLKAYIEFRSIGGALELLSRLQSLTDSNQKRSLAEFFKELRAFQIRKKAKQPDQTGYQDLFPGVQFAGFFPQIPDVLLAKLLDLITETEMYEIGKWMIYSNDVDGPLIPAKSYSQQVLAPALIRFAAVTLDTTLLAKVSQAQTVDVSGQTLVALCDLRIRQGDWKGAGQVLSLVRDYSLHTWTTEDFALILRPLLYHVQAELRDQARGQACILLQRLLRGDLGHLWGPSFADLDTIVGVLSSIDDDLAGLCSNLVVRGGKYMVSLPVGAFNIILDGIVKAYGSVMGQKLWENWCTQTSEVRVVRLNGGADAGSTEPSRPDIKVLFGQPSSTSELESPAHAATFDGQIYAQLSTLRVIIQQALKENREAIAASSTPVQAREEDNTEAAGFEHRETEVLDWAARVLRQRFQLSDPDMNYELEGYRSTIVPILNAKPLYSRHTLKIWQAFTGSRRQWALTTERRVRDFANNKKETQILFDPTPAAERFFLHWFAHDLGMMSQSFGEEAERYVKMWKTPTWPVVPSPNIDEVLHQTSAIRASQARI